MKEIRILVDPERRKITVSTDNEEPKEFQGFVGFFGDAELHASQVLAYGSSADAAWAFGRTFAGAHEGKIKGLLNFFRQAAAWCCHRIDPASFQQEITAEEMLIRWSDCDEWPGDGTGPGVSQ